MAIKAETSFSLADQLFSEQSVGVFAASMAKAWRQFDRKDFTQHCLAAFPNLELKQRISYMVDQLDAQLPRDFGRAVRILDSALPAPLNPNLTDDDFGQFIWAVPAEWVARHGCTDDRLDVALNFLKQATMRFSVENAIRPFLASHPERTMDFIRSCTTDGNYHVRRLASEGIRPYLPWAQRVRLPEEQVVEVLTTLHADPTRYVTRSVANTLNDLSRDNPQLVIGTLKQWHDTAKQAPAELSWMTRHALRTLIKTDNIHALKLLGYPSEPKFSLSKVAASEVVTIGDALHWRGTLKSGVRQNLKVGLRVHFLRANGEHSIKVFAVKDLEAAEGAFEIEKKISFKPITTRALYLGKHYVELVVNGKTRAKRAFELKAADS